MNTRTTLLWLILLGGAAGCTTGKHKSQHRPDAETREQSIAALAARGDTAIPDLRRILKEAQRGPRPDSASYVAALDALARIGTDAAADALMREIRNASMFTQAWPAARLASMGAKAVPRLVKLTQGRELRWSRSPDDPPIHPHRQLTMAAISAGEALSLIRDPAAAPALGALLDGGWRDRAFEALTAMKVSGYELQARQKPSAAARRYLLAVDRATSLPRLEKDLQALDAEVARLQRDLAELRARRVRDSVGQEAWIIKDVFDMGGDPVAVGPFTRYIESRLWDRQHTAVPLGQRDAILAVLCLGLSRSAEAKPELLRLLADPTLLEPIRTTESGVRPEEKALMALQYCQRPGRNGWRGVPMCAVAAVALGLLGDASAVPALEQAAAANPDLRRVFDTAIESLQKR